MVPGKASIISEFEDGSRQSRRKFTRSRSTWELTWNKMKGVYFRILDDFIKKEAKFKSNTFNWTNPEELKRYEVRCIRYKAKLITVDQWQVEVQLQEA